MEQEQTLVEKYQGYLKQAGLKVDAGVFIAMAVALAIIFAVLTFFFLSVAGLFDELRIFVAVIPIVALDLFLGYPYLKAMQRIDAIEKALPEALKQMADTLNAGGTYEYALREIANAEYGPLAKEMNNVLRKLEEGENLENSLKSFSENIDSRLVSRSIIVIIDSIKAGAGLADVLEEISDDIREIYRIGQERKAKTTMQVMFMVAAGAIVAPLIFGIVSTIISFLVVSASQGLDIGLAARAQAVAVKDLIVLLMQAYIAVEILAVGFMLSLMRDGKMSKSIIYIPILLLLAFVCYFAAKILSVGLFGGVI
ncbi:MAG: type II secretion system F family protein [Candidatus Diapherotrites archaeon]|nr:type II secretion system F family protein [Candidatus Diapherotrites archaeon]